MQAPSTLPDGRVLVPGGHTDFETPVSSADLYDPRTGTWSDAGSMSDPRAGHSAVVLHGNRGVLVMGGLNTPPAATASVDIFQTH
jgi:N-acetylneuraminic acid mutarotase